MTKQSGVSSDGTRELLAKVLTALTHRDGKPSSSSVRFAIETLKSAISDMESSHDYPGGYLPKCLKHPDRLAVALVGACYECKG